MVYIKINTIEGYTSKERCEAINKELYAIKRPHSVRGESDVTNKVFSEIELTDGSYAMLVDLDYVFKVHKDRNITPLANLFPELTKEERDGLVDFIEENNEFQFKYIVPSGTSTYTKEQLITEGLIDDGII